MAKKVARPNNQKPATIPDRDAGCGKAGIAESLDQKAIYLTDPPAAFLEELDSRLGEGTLRQAELAGVDDGSAHA
ncbi:MULTISPECIES: hypothetical protein [unclassified Sinorhizobium]|uniref:hypothetical protein n=1 Tax=unclassified Sinorhizobium TaxID=2613772 RepID=UPI0024C3A901|nr:MULTISPECIES: hypothetical protein [unclassified Sinorhizobium]MDK1374248.1 hypothetical protein [Sinorhizobium sp. 6-70]MDK1478895.1 hypothetical protein [Sinorhizobium sp. 6-117]